MVTVLLHSGIGHPSLLWIVVASLISVILGLGIGRYSTLVAPLRSQPDPVEE